MIRVKVFVPVFCNQSEIDPSGWLEIQDESKLADVLKLIHLSKPAAKLMMAKINGEVLPFNTVLHDGDVISFCYIYIAGG